MRQNNLPWLAVAGTGYILIPVADDLSAEVPRSFTLGLRFW